MNYKIQMNCFNELLKKTTLLVIQKWRESFYLAQVKELLKELVFSHLTSHNHMGRNLTGEKPYWGEALLVRSLTGEKPYW